MGQAIDSIFGSTGEGGKNAGNIFNPSITRLTPEQLQNQIGGAINSDTASQDYTKQVQDNPMLSGLFGKGGTLENTIGQEKDLANRGYSLQPEDHEAYGQASGDITRMFGQNEQSLSQALADRGLSNSGVATNAFAGSLGNKEEQLANLQTQIAQKRMQMNSDRLNQTRNFLSSLGGQAQSAIQGQFNRNLSQADEEKSRANMAEGYMKDIQGQNNEALGQYQQTNHASGWGQLGAAGGQIALALATGGASGAAQKGMSGTVGSSTPGTDAGYGKLTTAINPNAKNGDYSAL